MRILFILVCSLCVLTPALAEEAGSGTTDSGASDSNATASPDSRDEASKSRDVILYGTDTEILSLTAILKESGDTGLDADLSKLLSSTGNAKLQEAVYDYFLSRLESSATPIDPTIAEEITSFSLDVLLFWDQYRESIIDQACRYVGLRRERRAVDLLLSLLGSGSDSLRPRVVNTLGKIGGEGIAGPLVAWLKENDPSSTLKNDIYRALGATQDREGASPFIKEALEDEYATPSEKMALLDAAGKLEDPLLLSAMLARLSDDDANVRASLIAALGSYEGDEVERALLDAFRDNFYKARISAAQAAGARKLESAIPFLIFRAERDSVLSVQLAAIEALSNFDRDEVRATLSKILKHELKADAVRAACARALLNIDLATYIPVAVEVMEASVQGKKQKPLYHELARLISTKEFEGARDLAARLIASSIVTDRHYALELIRTNRLTDLYTKVKELDSGKTDSLSRRARLVREALEKEGVIDTDEPEKDEKKSVD